MQIITLTAAGHAIAQIVKREFFRGAVGDVTGICLTTRFLVHVLSHGTDSQTESAVKRRECFRITCHQVVVGGHDVHGNTGKCRRRCAYRRGNCLSFAGGHLGELAIEHDSGGHQLRFVRLLPKCVGARARDERECFGHQRMVETAQQHAGTNAL